MVPAMKVSAFQLSPRLHISNPHGHQSQPLKLLAPTLKLKPSVIRITTVRTLPSFKKLLYFNSHEKIAKMKFFEKDSSIELQRLLLFGGFSFAFAILLLGFDGQQEAMAFGPEGPLVEEFWDNVRRYGIYFLTVSTGAIYTILQPIFELLKNPVTAILIIVLVVGSFYLLSQVLSAMVGVSEFSYQYAY
ncbi:uncharacterized protein LOC110037958 [Phalaenopsis equestris]|uniref:uncharacterized protein LOC110034781 n=1 Tax=Phalaenopsis equestris TaxID=78828 RepID=UPI0009E51B18|nr:uncharacterized protein LOC110034781 [Phalaenopsis equestris]XP_020598368.1 uncharacterized protein LOC110037958 [Phalaenopsis equestris]